MTILFCRQCLAPPFRVVSSSSLAPSFHIRAASRPSRLITRIPPHHNTSLTRTNARLYQHLAQQPQKAESPPVSPSGPPVQPKTPRAQDLGGDAVHVTLSEQRKRDWNIVRKLAENLWPKDDWKTRGRVVLGFGLLISGKVRGFAFTRGCMS